MGVVLLVFVAVFAVVALPLVLFGMGSAKREKQVVAALDSALAGSQTHEGEQKLDVRKQAGFSTIPWMDRLLTRLELGPRIHNLLRQANVKWTVGRLVAATCIIFVVISYGVNLRLHNFLISLPLGAAFAAGPTLWVMWRRQKRFDRFEQLLPEALDLMVSGLRAGHSLIAVMSLVANEVAEPVGAEFRMCYEEQNYGLELKTALENMQDRIPVQALRIVCTAILIQKESGGNLAEVLDKASGTIRERFRLRREVGVRTAQGRLTGIILTGLPIVLGLVMYLANPAMMSVLWTTPLGVKLLTISSIMVAVGALLIRHIVNLEI
jgi:tight adherence protein B